MTLGNYIYKIFVKCRAEEDVHDLVIAHAMVRLDVNYELPEGFSEIEVNRFMGKHYKELVQNFAEMSAEDFAKAVETMRLDDLDEEKLAD